MSSRQRRGRRLGQPHRNAASSSQDPTAAFEEVNVLVTGFGPFDESPDLNPAWEIARRLPPVVPHTPAHPSRVKITVYESPVRVAYEPVDDLTSELLGSSTNFHLVLHIGVAPQRDAYTVERFARRDGYIKKDVDDKLPDPEKQPSFRRDAPEVLETIAHLDDVLPRWAGEVPTNTTVKISEDAGLYICEYQFFGSLAKVSESNGAQGWQSKTTVEFLHVPGNLTGDGEEITDQEVLAQNYETGKDVALALIIALIDSRRQRDGDFDHEADE